VPRVLENYKVINIAGTDLVVNLVKS